MGYLILAAWLLCAGCGTVAVDEPVVNRFDFPRIGSEDADPMKRIEQHTKGRNSPAIVGVEGDVVIRDGFDFPRGK